MNPLNPNSQIIGRCPTCGKALLEGVAKGHWHNCPYKCPLEGIPVIRTRVAAPVATMGLGDLVEKGINFVASLVGHKVVKTKGCGCERRKQQLNKLMPF